MIATICNFDVFGGGSSGGFGKIACRQIATPCNFGSFGGSSFSDFGFFTP